MKVTIKQYHPARNFIVAKLTIKKSSDGGIVLAKGKADKWMEVIKVGDLVTAVKPGDYIVAPDPRAMIQMEFDGEHYMQLMEHDLIGFVPKEEVPEQPENQLILDIKD